MFASKAKLALLITLVVAALAMLAARRLGVSAGMKSDSPKTRIDTISRLTGERPAGAAAVIAHAAGSDPDPGVRRVAIVALPAFHRPDDRAIIEHALADNSPLVRAAAASTLGSYGPEAVARLSALAEDPSEEVRSGVVEGLRQTGRGLGMATLLQMMARHGDPDVQMQAFHAIESISKRRYEQIPDPRNAAGWAHLVLRVRDNPWVIEALATEHASGGAP